MKKLLNFILLITLISFNIYSQKTDQNYKQLINWLQGSYSSEKQSKEDSSFFDIRLKIAPIWKDRKDAAWFLVEQAAAETIDKPYRQRVYKVTTSGPGIYESAIFTFRDPLRYAGKLTEFEKEMRPDSLTSKDGCSVFLKKVSKILFEGSTKEKSCPSELRKAKYASSEVKLYKDKLISWDRGFDENDKQVWGAVKGGYIFIKKVNKK